MLLLFSETGRAAVRGAAWGGVHVFTIQSVDEGARETSKWSCLRGSLQYELVVQEKRFQWR